MIARRRGSSASRAGGFTLLGVLAAIIILSVGLLGMVRAMLASTQALTQNQIVSEIGNLGNAFWGTVQANPSMLVDSTFPGTFTSVDYMLAPAPLQAWLLQATTQLPSGQVTIATSPDAGSGLSCAVSSGCTVTMTMQWSQVASPSIAGQTRSQTFFYQFGL